MRMKFPERGPDYARLEDNIKAVLSSQPDTMIKVVEGTDELCQLCLNCVDGRCASPLGDEEGVRKWDAILLKELDLPFGTCMASAEWKALIEKKIPFKLCQRCQWRTRCAVDNYSPGSS
jgi:hypothetical protein